MDGAGFLYGQLQGLSCPEVGIHTLVSGARAQRGWLGGPIFLGSGVCLFVGVAVFCSSLLRSSRCSRAIIVLLVVSAKAQDGKCGCWPFGEWAGS